MNVSSIAAVSAACVCMSAMQAAARAVRNGYYIIGRGNKMENDIFLAYLGKRVTVKTLGGDCVDGILDKADGGFILMKHPKDEAKKTVVNISTIETMKINEKK